ncbi:MAG: GNAT family N-acetyltransferase [Bacteroidota bacterium]
MIDEELVGMLNVVASPKPRLQHVGEFGVSVLKNHWNKGIASLLINRMISWAEKSKIIKKINLKVLQNNDVAFQLYKRLGFEIEGLLRRDFFVKGVYYDAYMMGMLID